MFKQYPLHCLMAVILVTALSVLTGRGVEAQDLDLGAPTSTSSVAWSGDAELWGDWVRDIPLNQNINRGRLRLRYGPTWQISDAWTLAAAVRVNESTDSNADTILYMDNQRNRDLALDRLVLSYAPDGADTFRFGKDALPLTLTSMLWDPNLRPAGVSYTHQADFGDTDTWRLVAGGFSGQQMSGDQSKLAALQLGLHFHQGGLASPEFILSGLKYYDTQSLAAAGLARQNLVQNGAYLDNYTLADAQFILHINAAVPLRLLLDLDRNLQVDHDNQAERLEFDVGDSFHAHGLEAGIAAQRIQQEAVLGAFNSDEWWFHSWSHGDLLWIGYGLSDTLRLRLAGYYEGRDDLTQRSRRVLLSLYWTL